MDVESGKLSSFRSTNVAACGQWLLENFEWFAGENIRTTLEALGIDHRGLRLAELRPPKGTYELETGKRAALTLSQILSSTVAPGAELAPAEHLQGLLEARDLGGVAEELGRDLQLLNAMRRYGQLHGCVRATTGFYDELIPIHWRLRDGRELHSLKEQALEARRELDVVLTPLFSDQDWQLSRRCSVRKEGRYGNEIFLLNGELVDELQIHACRLAPDGGSHLTDLRRGLRLVR